MNVIKGPAAIKIGKYWRGVASGNVYSEKLRMTPGRALEDAAALEPKIEPNEQHPNGNSQLPQEAGQESQSAGS